MVSKYDALNRDLISKANAGERNVSMTFSEIERILGDPLPASARKYRPWWGNEKAKVLRQEHGWTQDGK